MLRRHKVATFLLWWLALFGVWPLADPGHTNVGSPLVWVDLVLHFAALGVLVNREIDRRAGIRAVGKPGR